LSTIPFSVCNGGTSAEANLAGLKASAGYFDNLPTTGNMAGQVFLEWEKRVQLICQESAIGAQFEKIFYHDSCDSFATSRCFLSGRIRSFMLSGQKYQRKITKDGIL
jgi:hypothetical protein